MSRRRTARLSASPAGWLTANPGALAFYRAAGFTECGLAETELGTAPRMALTIF
jgi:ribosomal protein S18 acetylase RimI-like enzyme